jgi:hypothetical protein
VGYDDDNHVRCDNDNYAGCNDHTGYNDHTGCNDHAGCNDNNHGRGTMATTTVIMTRVEAAAVMTGSAIVVTIT